MTGENAVLDEIDDFAFDVCAMTFCDCFLTTMCLHMFLFELPQKSFIQLDTGRNYTLHLVDRNLLSNVKTFMD